MKEGVALSQLADILPPPAPGGMGWLLPVIGFAVIVAALVLVWFVKRHRPGKPALPVREAQQRLAMLRAAWQARTFSDREAAYRLAAVLRLGLNLPQLTPRIRPRVVDDEALWRETLTQLQVLRYREQAPLTLPPHCFDRAERWLAAARRAAR